jgi:hypothetical protein
MEKSATLSRNAIEETTMSKVSDPEGVIELFHVSANDEPSVAMFKQELNEIANRHADLIKTLDAEIAHSGRERRFDDLVTWNVIDEIKGALGAASANDLSDEDADDDMAVDDCLDAADTFVSEHVSGASRPTIIASSIWLYGDAEATRMIRGAIAPARTASVSR